MGEITKTEEQEGPYGGGDGLSFETAVIVNRSNHFAGIASEYAWIEERCGKNGVDWERGIQMHSGRRDEHGVRTDYDVIDVIMASGEIRRYYFETEGFFMKGITR